jgi:hypothetical protein
MAHPHCLVRGVLFALFLLCTCAGCSNERDHPTEPGTTGPRGTVVYHSSCLSHGRTEAAADSSRPDCVSWEYDGAGTLLLRHFAAPFNCCPESLLAAVTVRGDTILVAEDEQLDGGGCNCLCVYELHIRITGLRTVPYRVRVREKYLPEGEAPLDFAVDLATSPTGARCEERHSYPWRIYGAGTGGD